MKKVKIAENEVFPIGFGTWSIGNNPHSRQQEMDALRTGIENGIQVIDTAEMYGNGASEMLVADAIAPYNREDLYLISKVLPQNASKNKLKKSLDKSLQRLRTDYLDQYILHWQGSIPLHETVEALEMERQKGKIKSWGVSNLDFNELSSLLKLKEGKFCSSNQIRYNLGDRGIEYDLLPLMNQHNMPLIAYSPLAKGDNSGENFGKQKILIEIAEKHQCDVFQILLAWCIRDGNTIAIPKSSNPTHALANVKAAGIRLDNEDLAKIDQCYTKPTSKVPLALW